MYCNTRCGPVACPPVSPHLYPTLPTPTNHFICCPHVLPSCSSHAPSFDSLYFVQAQVLLYTANGDHLQTYTPYEHALGVQTFSWSPSGQLLALGSCDERVRFLQCARSSCRIADVVLLKSCVMLLELKMHLVTNPALLRRTCSSLRRRDFWVLRFVAL